MVSPALAFTGLAAQQGLRQPAPLGLRGRGVDPPKATSTAAEVLTGFGAYSRLAFGGAIGAVFARGALSRRKRGGARKATLAAADTTKTNEFTEGIDWSQVSNEWEVDCFSRPVMREGKKMWELMLTDANGVYRRVAQMKATRVNSVVVQKILQVFIDESQVKPRSIRFYRKVMKNMLTVALNTVKDSNAVMEKCKIIPSRNCHMLRRWLSYREREVYPTMQGFTPVPPRRTSSLQSSMVQMSYEPLPEKLRFIRYAVSAIPLGALAALKPGQLPGQLASIPAGYAENAFVNGIIILSGRADTLCSIMKSMELNAVRFDTNKNEMVMDFGIDQSFVIEKVPTAERESCVQFERTKRQLGGLHFVAVHDPLTGGEPNLPVPVVDGGDQGSPGEGCITGLWLLFDYAPQDEEAS